jgi:two-component system alkaline phosphatase synthesis response regulator PhoP
MLMKKILIIEDDKDIGFMLSYYLTKEGFNVELANTAKEGMKKLDEVAPNLLILDLMLPDGDGFDICQEVSKKYKIPIIMLTAKSSIADKIQGLSLGADDYITKPFDIGEVIARINSIFRRFEKLDKFEQQDRDSIDLGDIKIFKAERRVLKEEKEIEFTVKEFELLLLLAENQAIVFSRDQLLERVWGFDFYGDTRTVDVHIQRIRKKLGEEKENSIIKTVFKTGYKLVHEK